MKKLILSIAVLISFSMITGAQILLSDDSGNDITNDTLVVNGFSHEDYIKVHVYFTNDSDEAQEVLVRKIEHDIVDGSECVFCWYDYCFSPQVFEVDNPIILEPGETSASTDFYSDFYPMGVNGISYVEFEFFNDRESFEPVSVVIKFVITADETSVFHHELARWSLSDPQPNPARGHTWINYSLPAGSSNAQIVIRNLLGKSVHTENISIGSDRVRINTQSLNNGIYIYSLIIDNQIVESKRLIVTN
ncbi:MAG: T9SS type A sorting domain-containing protein [Bacteroidales bacterium]|nr:T9SS type A sorting domain-containing protein [Bacteroidales bacterium]